MNNQPSSDLKKQVKDTLLALINTDMDDAKKLVAKTQKEIDNELLAQKTFNPRKVLNGVSKRLSSFGITFPNKPNFAVQDDGHGEFTICTLVAQKGKSKILGIGVSKRNKRMDAPVAATGQQHALQRAIFGNLGVVAKAGIQISQLKKPKPVKSKSKPKKVVKAKHG